MEKLTQSREWKALEAHCEEMRGAHMRDLFAGDPARFEKFHLKRSGLLFDFSKNRISEETIHKLCALARACGLEARREEMFSGAVINESEGRAVLHTALRGGGENIVVDGENVAEFVENTLARIREVSDKIRREGRFTDIVNIGIGGSDLGPSMVCEALAHLADGPRVHFVSNIDGAHLASVLKKCAPESAAFIIASKTFTTLETLTNAQSAKNWLAADLKPEAVNARLIAVTQNTDGAQDFGVAKENILPLRDWIGGRYSLWGAIGLPVAVALGFENFRALLDGAHAMDKHFRLAPLEENMPVILALLGIWHRNFFGYEALALLPYAQALQRFPAYIQQLDMESNGKSVDRDGRRIDYATAPVIFGEPGTNGQHAFFQLLHQGTDIVPCDFIGFTQSACDLPGHREKLLANMLAQSQALMQGQEEAGSPQKNFEGNRPGNALLLERLDPHHLGMLLALYEHKVFVQGVIWNINSFDQWGVELGKKLAKNLIPALEEGAKAPGLDFSTQALLAALQKKILSPEKFLK